MPRRCVVKAALPLADIAKRPIAAAWSDTQTFPADNAVAGLPPAEKIVANHVSAVVVEDAPVVPIAWVCGYAEAPGKMTLHGRTLTDIPDSLLPMECRALKR